MEYLRTEYCRQILKWKISQSEYCEQCKVIKWNIVRFAYGKYCEQLNGKFIWNIVNNFNRNIVNKLNRILYTISRMENYFMKISFCCMEYCRQHVGIFTWNNARNIVINSRLGISASEYIHICIYTYIYAWNIVRKQPNGKLSCEYSRWKIHLFAWKIFVIGILFHRYIRNIVNNRMENPNGIFEAAKWNIAYNCAVYPLGKLSWNIYLSMHLFMHSYIYASIYLYIYVYIDMPMEYFSIVNRLEYCAQIVLWKIHHGILYSIAFGIL